MRVGVFVGEHAVEAGGAFTLVDDIVAGMRRNVSRHEFVLISIYGPWRKASGQLAIMRNASRTDFRQRVLRRLERILPFWIRMRLGIRTLGERLDRLLRDNGIDIIYYPDQQYIPTDIPAVLTLWDLAHRLYPFFPEVSRQGVWEEREKHFSIGLPRASAVIVGTPSGREQVQYYYKVHKERIHIIPLPTPDFALKCSQEALPPPTTIPPLGRFLFYPAQLWAHKNHATLLYGLKKIHETHPDLQLVLTGANKGNLNYLRGLVDSLQLLDSVFFLGFVDRSILYWLYRNCEAMVFPSFFGPDNLPPLEAMALGAPVIVADIEGARDQLGDSVLFFSPTDPEDIADRVVRLLQSPELRSQMVEKGYKRAGSWSSEDYCNSVITVIDDLEKMIRCWRPLH